MRANHDFDHFIAIPFASLVTYVVGMNLKSLVELPFVAQYWPQWLTGVIALSAFVGAVVLANLFWRMAKAKPTTVETTVSGFRQTAKSPSSEFDEDRLSSMIRELSEFDNSKEKEAGADQTVLDLSEIENFLDESSNNNSSGS